MATGGGTVAWRPVLNVQCIRSLHMRRYSCRSRNAVDRATETSTILAHVGYHTNLTIDLTYEKSKVLAIVEITSGVDSSRAHNVIHKSGPCLTQTTESSSAIYTIMYYHDSYQYPVIWIRLQLYISSDTESQIIVRSSSSHVIRVSFP